MLAFVNRSGRPPVSSHRGRPMSTGLSCYRPRSSFAKDTVSAFTSPVAVGPCGTAISTPATRLVWTHASKPPSRPSITTRNILRTSFSPSFQQRRGRETQPSELRTESVFGDRGLDAPAGWAKWRHPITKIRRIQAGSRRSAARRRTAPGPGQSSIPWCSLNMAMNSGFSSVPRRR